MRQATGKEEGPYSKDIADWKELRQVPAMSKYFENMYTYHISYAAFPNTDEFEPGYIRARRYLGSDLAGTEIEPDYDPGDFFKMEVPHKMTVIKSGDHLFMKVENSEDSLLCHWHNTEFPAIEEGRIGLRHMFTRAARYRNFSISVLG